MKWLMINDNDITFICCNKGITKSYNPVILISYNKLIMLKGTLIKLKAHAMEV